MIRVSGGHARTALAALAHVPEPRRAELAAIASRGTILDHGLVLWFPGPASATGEDIAEFHVHGGRAVVAAVLDALAALPGLRPAEPGEFARRAFLAGKLDLAQAEALADLIAADTEAQRAQAQRQLQGGLSRRLDGWRDEILRALAHVEAAIDFADDEVPGADVVADTVVRVNALLPELRASLDRRGERLRDGVHAVILGAPNVGKSSLLNRLAQRDAAIVSATAGTTRDVLEVHLDVGGYPVILADTAGLRATADEVESEGVRRALTRAAAADIKIAIFDAAAWPARDAATAALVDATALVVVNKSDILPSAPPSGEARGGGSSDSVYPISARTGAGMDEFLAALGLAVAAVAGSEEPALTRTRHAAAVRECIACLERFVRDSALSLELRAEELRLAARAIGRITGRVDVEDLLDVIFAEFCIGK